MKSDDKFKNLITDLREQFIRECRDEVRREIANGLDR